MKDLANLSRRRFLLQSGGVVAALGAPRFGRAQEAHSMRKIAPNVASESFHPDVDIELVAKTGSAPILPGAETRVWRYAANLVKGPDNTLTPVPESYLGPLMRFVTGQKIRIRLRNELPEQTITHWHGLHVPMLMDGHPMYAIDPGETFVYEFEMRNRASLNFYHPHPHERTARQVYRGLAGGIIVNDEEERALNLPSGEYEIPIVLQDRTLNDNNQLVYGGGMHTGMFGFYGEHVLVNGRPNRRFDVASRAYRLRLLNGSNARIFKLAWDDRTPITVIGVDGGLLEAPETKPYVMLAPGERLDVWADFSGRAVGSKLVMRSLEFAGALPGMARHMMGMMMETDTPPGGDYPVFAINVARTVSDSPALPKSLAKIARYRREDTANPDNPTPIVISEAPMSMLLNGRPYDDDILPNERVAVDTLRLIEIFHERGGGHMGGIGMMGRGMGMGGMGMMGGGMMGGMGMMMSMSHPIHLHGQQFQILGRSFGGDDDAYGSIREGLVTSGWKDTVLVAPGERVRIVKPFNDFKGRFMFHCHILEHEDMGMMRQFLVE
jgi:FtsP/CotA-like multicopper oxidase with cupredoxin domain